MVKKINTYKLVIWDLDGTLYYQRAFRLKMALVMLSKLLLRPSRWRELAVILTYRRIREEWNPDDFGEGLEERQYMVCGESCGMSGQKVRQLVEQWMLKEPLDHLKLYRDDQAAELIARLSEAGTVNVVYSDYPTRDKLKALNIQAERQFCSSDIEINCMKPNPRGIQYILKSMKIKAEDTLIIGDRMEKDGEAAKAAGVDYLILKKNKKGRKVQYKEILQQIQEQGWR